MNDLQGNRQTVINLLNSSVHSVGKRRRKEKKKTFILLHNSMHQPIHRRLWVQHPLHSSILSLCSDYFPTCPFTFNVLNKFLINPVFPSKMVSPTFVWNTSNNDISSHMAKHDNLNNSMIPYFPWEISLANLQLMPDTENYTLISLLPSCFLRKR